MPWTKEKDDRLREMMQAKAPIEEMMSELGEPRRSVRNRKRVIERGGFTPHPWTPEERAQVVVLMKQGLTAREVGVKMGRTYEASRRICREIRAGYITDRPKRNQPVKPKPAPIPHRSGDERYAEALRDAGGFVTLSERIASNGQPIACLPLVKWGEAA